MNDADWPMADIKVLLVRALQLLGEDRPRRPPAEHVGDGRWIWMERAPTQDERNFKSTFWQLEALDAYDAAEGQRVKSVSWCIPHNHEYIYHARHPEDPNHCLIVRGALILPPRARS